MVSVAVVMNISRLQVYQSKYTYWILSVLIVLTWVAAVFDPIGNVYSLRYVSLISVFLWLFLKVSFSNSGIISVDLRFVSVFYFAVLTPFYGLLLFLIRGGWQGDFIDTSYLASGILMISTLIYVDKRSVDIGLSAMIAVLRMLAITILLVQLSSVFSIGNSWVSFFTERNVALVSYREYAGFQFPYVYFLASPILIYIVGYDWCRFFKNPSFSSALLCLLSVFALALSGTRAHILIAALSFPIFFVYTRGKYSVVTAILALITISSALLIYDPQVIGLLFSPTETSNSMKIGMLDNYANIFDSPITFLFGQGFNAHVWSDDVRIMIGDALGASKSELTYLEIIRVYGLIIGIPAFIIFGLVLRRIFSMPHEYRWLGLSFLLYLVNAAINPYIFSTNGILPFGLILALVSCNKRIKVSDS